MRSNSADVSQVFKNACLSELEALKPGNVHIFADGHGMVVADFIGSAEAAARVIAQPGLSVGQRVLEAVRATRSEAGCNTNLGIILLAAPLIQAALHAGKAGLRTSLKETLHALSVKDAVLAYQAIQLAAPAGLGKAGQHDVHGTPAVSLLVAMQAASERDLIARQYADGFREVFEFGLNRYQQTLAQWERPAWATTAVYLGFLARFNDSHIERKFGSKAAAEVRHEAENHEKTFISLENPKNYLPELLEFDASLKARGLNPGTSADLTVATLMVAGLQSLLDKQ